MQRVESSTLVSIVNSDRMSQIVGAHCLAHGTGEEDSAKATEISKNSLELVIPTMSCIQPSIYPIVYAPHVLI